MQKRQLNFYADNDGYLIHKYKKTEIIRMQNISILLEMIDTYINDNNIESCKIINLETQNKQLKVENEALEKTKDEYIRNTNILNKNKPTNIPNEKYICDICQVMIINTKLNIESHKETKRHKSKILLNGP